MAESSVTSGGVQVRTTTSQEPSSSGDAATTVHVQAVTLVTAFGDHTDVMTEATGQRIIDLLEELVRLTKFRAGTL